MTDSLTLLRTAVVILFSPLVRFYPLHFLHNMENNNMPSARNADAA